jgi:hypothetical protein
MKRVIRIKTKLLGFSSQANYTDPTMKSSFVAVKFMYYDGK